MNPLCMRCDRTSFPRVPGLCVCQDCVERASSDQLKRWLKVEAFRQWYERKESKTFQEKSKTFQCKSNKLAKCLIEIIKAHSPCKLRSNDLKLFIWERYPDSRWNNDSTFQSTLRWMRHQKLVKFQVVHDGGNRHYLYSSLDAPDQTPDTLYNPGKPPLLASIVRSVLQDAGKPLHVYEIIDRTARRDAGKVRKDKSQFWAALRYLRNRKEVVSRRVKLEGYDRVQTVYTYREIQE